MGFSEHESVGELGLGYRSDTSILYISQEHVRVRAAESARERVGGYIYIISAIGPL